MFDAEVPLAASATTIAAGTWQIQRNLIANLMDLNAQQIIRPREAGEGNHAKHGGGGVGVRANLPPFER